MGETDEPYNRTLAALATVMHGNVQSHLELAIAYENLGLWDEAVEVLQRIVNPLYRDAKPLPLYHLAFCVERAGRADEAAKLYQKASQAIPDTCFPSRPEEEPILRHAMEVNLNDAGAPYYLGCLLYDNQPENAIAAWEESRKRDSKFALVHRNLGLAYAQHQKDTSKAIASLEKAVELNSKDPRLLYELDIQNEAGGTAVKRRLEWLTKESGVAAQRDDSLTRLILVYLADGQLDKALEILTTHRFHNWEGSSDIRNVYVDARLMRGQQHLRAKRAAEALKDFETALEFPANLEVGRPKRDGKAAQIACHIALAHEALGNADKAKAFFAQASAGRGGGGGGASETSYYRALGMQKVGRADDAKAIFENLVNQGQELQTTEPADYFAKFGEKRAERVRKADAHYLTGLGYLGLGKKTEADAEFKKALELHPAHLGCISRQLQ